MKKDRVQKHTADEVNERIEAEAERRVLRSFGQSEAALSRRIVELENEWDIERWLEMNASALAFSGVVLGLLVNKKFFAIPCIVLPFLFQHAVQGWCPPIPIFRRKGVRTRREIDANHTGRFPRDRWRKWQFYHSRPPHMASGECLSSSRTNTKLSQHCLFRRFTP